MTKYWIAVASHEHVKRGITDGICQVCHGKGGPLKQMTSDDWIIYYSPNETMTSEDSGQPIPCRRFTAIGRIKDAPPYQFQMSEDFIPWRRDVDFLPAKEASIEPLIDNLSFITDKRRWGFPFRRGVFSITLNDFNLIAASMGVHIP